MRKIYAMELMNTTQVKSFSSIREAAVLSAMQQIHAAANGQTPVALSELVMSTETLHPRHMLQDRAVGYPTAKNFSSVDEEAMQKQRNFLFLARETLNLADHMAIEDIFPSLRFLDVFVGARFKLQQLHRQLDSIFNDMIAVHQADRNNQTKNTRENILDVLLRLKEQDNFEFPITHEIIKAFVLEAFVGGTDTSTALIEWAMAEMMRNPKIREKAQQEMREALKGKTRLEESDIEELRYFKQVIKETLRLHEPGPLLMPRECREACQVLGFRVPAKTRVMVNAWALARDMRYWGPMPRALILRGSLIAPRTIKDSTMSTCHLGLGGECGLG